MTSDARRKKQPPTMRELTFFRAYVLESIGEGEGGQDLLACEILDLLIPPEETDDAKP